MWPRVQIKEAGEGLVVSRTQRATVYLGEVMNRGQTDDSKTGFTPASGPTLRSHPVDP